MITILFGFANEKILVTVKGKKVTFANTAYGAKETDINGLQLSYQGVITEFPDLQEDKNWEIKAIERFKRKIGSLSNESQITEYIISDLKNHGYTPEKIQRGGFRPKAIN